MVMFRDFVKRRARRLGLTGWVRNETSGDVTLVAEGEEEALQKLLAHARKGSMLSRVDEIDERWLPPTGLEGKFVIQY